MDELIKILANAEWTTILAMGAMFWIFNNHLAKKFDKIDQRFDKLEEKVTDVDRRMCRMEGAFSAKECCAIIPEKTLHKVE